MKYAVTIPTFGMERVEILTRTVDAFLEQTVPPALILVIDNNTEKGQLAWLDRTQKVTVCQNDYPTPGIIHGDQTGLRIVADLGFKYAARWDDDLVPRSDCMEKLCSVLEKPNVVAVGGMYPSPTKPGKCYLNNSGLVVPDGNPRHAQFYEWNPQNEKGVPICSFVLRHFLYSSFVYDVEAARAIGGFCTEYSQHSFRADTDFTLRLGQFAGLLCMVTDAVADHHFGDGGTRRITGKTKQDMLQADLKLFGQRMSTLGIDPNY